MFLNISKRLWKTQRRLLKTERSLRETEISLRMSLRIVRRAQELLGSP
jgi:hypothetical protein